MTDLATTAAEALTAPLTSADAGITDGTVRDYLITLLATIWEEGESFSGKRPFGNSAWEYDIYQALVEAGLVAGKIDEDGYLLELDRASADELVAAAIQKL